MKDLKISKPSFEEVDVCRSSSQGENLLHGYGVETTNLDPEHYFVPWITFDSAWNKDDFDASLADLQEFLCQQKLSHVPECKEQ